MTRSIHLSVATTKRLLVVIVAGTISFAGALVYAAVEPFGTDETLTATKLNGNFADLNTRLATLEAKAGPVNVGGKLYSRDATYKDSTAATKGAFASAKATGYAAAKELCENKLTPTAHMCTAEEVLRSQQLAVPLPKEHWYSAGVFSYDSPQRETDCAGWTVDTSGAEIPVGPTLGPGGPGPAAPFKGGCDFARPIMRCDLPAISRQEAS